MNALLTETEISEERMPLLVKHDVIRLQVPKNDVSLVQIL